MCVMLTLLPGTSPSHAADLMEGVARQLRDLQGCYEDSIALHTEYVHWAGHQMRRLTSVMSTGELDRLVTTPWHWAISGMDLSKSKRSIRPAVDAQINETLRRLDEEAGDIRTELARWDNGEAAAAVLDTNTLTAYPDSLAELDWNTILDQRPPTPIVLALPLKVIDELDKLKLSNARPDSNAGDAKDNKPRPLREKAQSALKWIESTLVDPSDVVHLGTVNHAGDVQSPLRLALIRQDPRRIPLADADAEIMDRALSLVGYASTVRLVTFDTGMILRARAAGLEGVRPPAPKASRGGKTSAGKD